FLAVWATSFQLYLRAIERRRVGPARTSEADARDECGKPRRRCGRRPVAVPRYDPRPMANAGKHKVTTPPKGRPTPTRTRRGSSRTFGSTFQWAALVVALLVVFVIAYLLLDGGDFNPWNDE